MVISFLRSLAFDDTINIASKLSQLVKGPLLMGLVLLNLTISEQANWYVMISLASLGMMADFGVSTLLMQSLAKTNVDKHPILISYSVKNIIYSLLVVNILLLMIGAFVFKSELKTLYYTWVAFCLSNILIVFITVFSSILQGKQRTNLAFGIRFLCVNLVTLFNCIFLFWGFGLDSLWLSNVLTFFTILALALAFGLKINFSKLYSRQLKLNLEVVKEISDQKKRYIVSWISGFVLFSSILPILKLTSSVELVATTGLCFAATRAIGAVSISWLETVSGKLGVHIGKNDFDYVFNSLYAVSKRVIYTFFVLFFSALLVVYIANNYSFFYGRIPSVEVFLYIGIAEFFYLMMNIFSKYTRVFCIELFAIHNVIFCILVGLGALLALTYLSYDHWLIVFLLTYMIIGFPLYLLTFLGWKKRQKNSHNV